MLNCAIALKALIIHIDSGGRLVNGGGDGERVACQAL